jgi:hypothetical protein
VFIYARALDGDGGGGVFCCVFAARREHALFSALPSRELPLFVRCTFLGS